MTALHNLPQVRPHSPVKSNEYHTQIATVNIDPVQPIDYTVVPQQNRWEFLQRIGTAAKSVYSFTC